MGFVGVYRPESLFNNVMCSHEASLDALFVAITILDALHIPSIDRKLIVNIESKHLVNVKV